MSHATSKVKLPITAGIIGNALEWYDFLLYAYFAPILAPLFFPAKDPFVSLLLTFSVFALGFLVRPAGAIVIGRIGDKYGRRKALLITMSLMTIPTVLVGLLPGYAQIGIWAPLLLILIRIAQGLAVSGEIASAATYMIEYAHPNRRGFAGSLVMSSAFFWYYVWRYCGAGFNRVNACGGIAFLGMAAAFFIGGRVWSDWSVRAATL